MPEQCGFIFDMDGTIVNNMRYHMKAWLELFEELGVSMAAEEFNRRLSGRTNPEILKRATGGTLSEEKIENLATKKEARYREIYQPHMELVPGLDHFLDQAQDQRIPMAVATSAPGPNITYILDRLHIRPYFLAVVGAEDVTHSKPHPEMFLTTADRLTLPPANCIVFEDSLAGVEAARRAGMPTVALTTTHGTEEFRESAGVILATPDFTTLTPDILLPRVRNRHSPS